MKENKMLIPIDTITLEDKQDLQRAKEILENPGFAIKVANYIGKPIEMGLEKIDSKVINDATSKALNKSLDIAISTLDTTTLTSSFSNLKHKIMVGGSGAVGGFFGIAALAIELPISTTIMLRSIADIAKSQEHDLDDFQTQLACLEVFSLGSTKNRDDDAGESVYFASRSVLAYEMKLAVDSVANMSQKAIQEALARGQMPILVKLVNNIAARFGITVSEKLVAQVIPVVGAAGGAAINLMFINHFQDMAEGHFIVKRLEKRYGYEAIKQLYQEI